MVVKKLSLVHFIFSVFLGGFISLIALAVANYYNVWKQDWQAEYRIISTVLLPPSIRPYNLAKVPDIIGPVFLEKAIFLDESTKTPLLELHPQIKRTRIEQVNHKFPQIKILKPKKFLHFERKLSVSETSFLPCPESKSTFWDNCFGTFNAPWDVVYSGIWRKDKLNGWARSINLKNGETYIGEFSNNMQDGCGVFVSKNGQVQSGLWTKNTFTSSSSACFALLPD